jgi:hypothetical protein
MNFLIARGGNIEGSDVLAFLACAAVLLIFGLIAIARIREAISPRQIGNRMRRFFGPDVKLLQAHEKNFKGLGPRFAQRRGRQLLRRMLPKLAATRLGHRRHVDPAADPDRAAKRDGTEQAGDADLRAPAGGRRSG